ncbi:transporter [Acinetobacter tandoii]
MKKSLCLSLCSLFTITSYAADTADLAKQLSNPVAAMVSVPFQLNYDEKIGAEEDIERYQLNIQPVIPISLNEDWNLISRTVLPVVYQTYGDSSKYDDWGTGDTVQSLFLSPVDSGPGGIIWGIGPAMLLPTASEKTLGADQWGLGPTAVVLKQMNGWTFGALANHIWAVEHKDNAEGISSTFLQPFVSYTYPSSLTISLNSEATYDWNSEDATIPINLSATKIVNLNGQLISVGGGVRYWADDTTGSAKEWGGRLIASFIFPK